MTTLPNLLNYTLAELATFLVQELGEKPFRAKQIWKWLWQKLATDFSSMTDVSRETRAKLATQAAIRWPKIVTIQKSLDGTTKFLLELFDQARIETVLLTSLDHEGRTRYSQCLSTQVGCAMGCTFCATGAMGFERNLTMDEILGQVLVVRNYLGDKTPDHPLLRNLVFMGMGEPLLNLHELLRALAVLNDPHGLAFSPRRITVSTCGIQHGLLKLGESGLCYLAVSLHAPTQQKRAILMPRAARWPLHEMLSELASYPLKARERITFEYILLKGVNTSCEDARLLARLILPLKAKLNLIVYNATEDSPYETPTEDEVLAFEQELWKRNITAIVRQSKGQDIDAACGQLKARLQGSSLQS